MHNAALDEMGLAPEWRYEAIEVAAEGFDDLVRSLPGDDFAGVNVTVPHKLAALAIADEASAAARAIGAANVLTFGDGRIRADNTDTNGVVDPLPESPSGKRALVLGAGGSARATIWALANAGAEVEIWNRTAAKAKALAEELGGTAVGSADTGQRTADYDLIVNCTTIGMATAAGEDAGDELDSLPLDLEGLHPGQAVIDLVYGRSQTLLVGHAKRAGATTVDGLDVLAYQGVVTLGIWTGRTAPLATMLAAARGEPA